MHNTVPLMPPKPLIGITCSFREFDPKRKRPTPLPFDLLKQAYCQAVWKTGGLPVMLPNLADEEYATAMAERMAGVVFSGGEDVEPLRFEEGTLSDKEVFVSPGRDRFEFNFFEKIYRCGIPILGICRGHQFINVALGGSLYQDLSLVPKKTFGHQADWHYGVSHPVELEKDSRLASLLKQTRVECNTNHHQVLKNVAPGLRTVGICPDDGIIEACEAADGRPLLTVQWHPEMMMECPAGEALFAWIVREASNKRT